MKKYRVFENNTILIETDDKEEAIWIMKKLHEKQSQKYHEIYQLTLGNYVGIRQYKPGDEVKW